MTSKGSVETFQMEQMKSSDIDAKIYAELQRLTELRTPRALRERTILLLAKAAVNGETRQSILARGNTVSSRTFHDSNKQWFAGSELFREVLENITELERKRDFQEKQRADAIARQKRHEERAAFLNGMKSDLVTLREAMLDAVTNGDVLVKPSEYSRFVKIIFDEEREEFGDGLRQELVSVNVQQKSAIVAESDQIILSDVQIRALSDEQIDAIMNGRPLPPVVDPALDEALLRIYGDESKNDQ